MREMLPQQASAFLADHPDALFIDCRSAAEYLFVGHPPGAVHVAWAEWPGWTPNPDFVASVRALADDATDRPLVLMCRSGQRSAQAAQALEAAGFTDTINLMHGFEGDRDAQGQRGRQNGWRHDGLPWQQG